MKEHAGGPDLWAAGFFRNFLIIKAPALIGMQLRPSSSTTISERFTRLGPPAMLLRHGRVQQVFRAFVQRIAAAGESAGQCARFPGTRRPRASCGLSDSGTENRGKHDTFPGCDRTDRHRDAEVFWYLSAGHAGFWWSGAGGH